MEIRVNNRLDVLDRSGWREALVVHVNGKVIRVRFRGRSARHDEEIDVEKQAFRIREVGAFSNAEGWAKYSQRYQEELQEEMNKSKPQAPSSKQNKENKEEKIDWEQEETKFLKMMADKNFRIVDVAMDGNCLFRAIAHQAYGDEELHALVREKCMEYIECEKEYFKSYIIGGEHLFEMYIQRKKQSGIWGDDLEIQALSEIYNRSIEIYAYSNIPMRTFHEQEEDDETTPFRLSYHGQSHYNSVVPQSWDKSCALIKQSPGTVEEEAIEISRELNEQEEAEDWEEGLKNLKRQAYIVKKSRQEFEVEGKKDMEQAVKEQVNKPPERFELANLNKAIRQSQLEVSEEQLMKQALEESMKEFNEKNPVQNNPMQYDELIMKTIMEMSMKEFDQQAMNKAMKPQEEEMNPAVKIALSNGYSLEQAVEAISIVGENPDMVINYLVQSNQNLFSFSHFSS